MHLPLALPALLLSLGFLPLACGGSTSASEDSCADEEDLPAGFTCSKAIPLTQSECEGSAYGSEPPSISSTEEGLVIERAQFRCQQEACAYVDSSGERTQVLVQPCDMHPSSPARCDCLSRIALDIEVPAVGADVYTRFDSLGGEQEPKLIGSTYAANSVLCDGSDDLRFALNFAGGNYSGIPRVFTEVGFNFLLVDGKCNYYAMSDAEAEIRQGTLSAEQAQAFSEQLMLGHWDEFPSNSASNCTDGTTVMLRSPTEKYSLTCDTSELTKTAYDALSSLYDAGTPLDQEVRYVVAEADDTPWNASALPWPLEADPASLAVGIQEDDLTEPLIATGSDAAALRELRTEWLAAVAGGAMGNWMRIPVVFEAVDGAHYFDVALRDVTPFETDGELDIDGHFSPAN